MQDNYTEIDDLVEQVKNKNSEALWKLFDYYKPVIHLASNQVNKKYPSVEKEDLLSESVFILQDLCNKFDKDKSYFSYFFSTRLQPYLVSKVKSKYLEKINVVDLDQADNFEYYDNLNFTINDHTNLHMEIENLPEKMQQILDLFYFKGLNQTECAIILKISQPAFNKKLQKTLKLLKENLSKEL